jgi:hypothetical protein
MHDCLEKSLQNPPSKKVAISSAGFEQFQPLSTPSHLQNGAKVVGALGARSLGARSLGARSLEGWVSCLSPEFASLALVADFYARLGFIEQREAA